MKWNDYQKECERLAKQAIKENLDANGILNEQGAYDTLPNIAGDSYVFNTFGQSWDLCNLVYSSDAERLFHADEEAGHAYESKCILQVMSEVAYQLLFAKAQEELEILIEAYNDRRVSKESFSEILEGYAL